VRYPGRSTVSPRGQRVERGDARRIDSGDAEPVARFRHLLALQFVGGFVDLISLKERRLGVCTMAVASGPNTMPGRWIVTSGA
jgi:hypothetical protein